MLTYGFLKSTVAGTPELKGSRRGSETQYHLHVPLAFADANGASQTWDSAINVGTDTPGDLLRYRLVSNFSGPVVTLISAAQPGFSDLTGTTAIPALDFLRDTVITSTGEWQDSQIMDGTETPQPVASLVDIFSRAAATQATVYLFGRRYADAGLGIHDVHMNQGSTGTEFANDGVDDHNDHNDIWQDGAVIVDFGGGQVSGYFTAFTQQLVPTDALGNPVPGANEIGDADPGSLVPNPQPPGTSAATS